MTQFNQLVNILLENNKGVHISQLSIDELSPRALRVLKHWFGHRIGDIRDGILDNYTDDMCFVDAQDFKRNLYLVDGINLPYRVLDEIMDWVTGGHKKRFKLKGLKGKDVDTATDMIDI